jgi:hypothetical protein
MMAVALEKLVAMGAIKDADLAEKVSDALNRGFDSDQSVDELLMTLSKMVEARLKKVIEDFTASTVQSRTGRETLDKAVDYHLIRDNNEPVYHLLSWYFSYRRNPTHHTFTSYSPHNLVSYVMGTQEALENVEQLATRPSFAKASFQFTQDIQGGRYAFRVDEIIHHSSRVGEARLDVVVKAPNGGIVRVPLTESSGSWSGVLDCRGWATGSYPFHFRGEYSSGFFLTSSGSAFTVSSRNCQNCHSPLGAFSTTCSTCGFSAS